MFDKVTLEAFLKNQKKLFKESVADTLDEAADFLEDCGAFICESKEDTLSYMKDNLDTYNMTDEEILLAEEVFAVGDGRYIIVEG